MKTITKLGGAVALSLLASAPLAQAQDTSQADAGETTKQEGHMGGGMAGMPGMEGMEGMMPMMMKHMQACMEMMETMNTHMKEHHDQADQG
ncbi:hypothetical protein [Cribrihabitans neustonicus]|uniref:hypothetical protein n=1 Tax=Cribrihabitans neustonicus TaxID=1429085 RepID=UPI003B599FBA